MARIELEDVQIVLGEGDRRFEVHDIDLDVADGEFVVFVGASGSGKSTVLRAIAGLTPIASGAIRIDGRRVDDVAPGERGVAMVFQSYALYPNMTVAGNLGFALKLARTAKAETARRVQETADLLQIGHLLDRRPHELSGGQRQRVAIGRCIIRNPGAFLFDEPLSNLDAALRNQMRIDLLRLHRDLGATSLYVTHDQVEAMTLADRIVLLDRGRIVQVGSPTELFESPRTRFVAEFVGSPRINVLPGRFAPKAPQTALHVGVRPRHLRIVEARGDLQGRVVLIERLGDESLLHVDVEGAESPVVASTIAAPPEAGATVHLALPEDRLLYFGEDGATLEREET
ncbi:MAG: ABC transporter ATP-binding protein [Myxococcota bacterium]